MLIGIIFVLYNTPEYDVVRVKKETAHLPGVRMYYIDQSGTQKGYAEGVNKGIKQARVDGCDIYIIANPDISIELLFGINGSRFLDIIEELVNRFDIGGFAMVQEGKRYYGGVVDRVRLSGGLLSTRPKEKYRHVDFVSGSLMVIKKEVVDKIGYFDEGYGMYYEDVDYCTRASRAGLKVGIITDNYYEHFENSSSNPNKKKLLFISRLLYLIKFGRLYSLAYELLRVPLTLIEEKDVIIKIFKSNTFLKNFLSLNISSLLNKVLFFGLFLVLTRTLKPEDYGIYSVVWSHVAIFSPFLDLGTTSYGIVHGATEKKNKLNDLIVMRAVMSIIVFVVVNILAWVWGYDTKLLTFITLASVITISNAFSGSYLILTSIFNRAYAATFLSTSFNFVLVVVQIIILLYTQRLDGIFNLVGILYFAYALVNVFFINKEIGLSLNVNVHEWFNILKKSYIYILIGLFAGFYYKADIFILNRYADAKSVGIYSAGYKFFDALLFIAASYNISSTPVFAKLHKEGVSMLYKRMMRDIKYMTALGFIVASAVLLVAPLVIALLRPDYAAATPVLGIVVFSLPFILYSSVLMNVLYVIGKPRIVLYVFVTQSIINISLNLLLVPKYSYFASSWITLLSEMLISLFLSLIVFGKYLNLRKVA